MATTIEAAMTARATMTSTRFIGLLDPLLHRLSPARRHLGGIVCCQGRPAVYKIAGHALCSTRSLMARFGVVRRRPPASAFWVALLAAKFVSALAARVAVVRIGSAWTNVVDRSS